MTLRSRLAALERAAPKKTPRDDWAEEQARREAELEATDMHAVTLAILEAELDQRPPGIPDVILAGGFDPARGGRFGSHLDSVSRKMFDELLPYAAAIACAHRNPCPESGTSGVS